MFSCKQKSISLEQLKENREKQIKSLDGNLDFPTKLLFTGIAFFVMYLMSDYVLKTLFDALTRVDGFDTRVQFVLNMVMYIMPLSFGFMALGLLTSSLFGWIFNLRDKVFLRRITKAIEVCSVQGETQHAE